MLARTVATLHSAPLCHAMKIGSTVTSRQACFCRLQRSETPRHTAAAEQPAGYQNKWCSFEDKQVMQCETASLKNHSTVEQACEAAACCYKQLLHSARWAAEGVAPSETVVFDSSCTSSMQNEMLAHSACSPIAVAPCKADWQSRSLGKS